MYRHAAQTGLSKTDRSQIVHTVEKQKVRLIGTKKQLAQQNTKYLVSVQVLSKNEPRSDLNPTTLCSFTPTDPGPPYEAKPQLLALSVL